MILLLLLSTLGLHSRVHDRQKVLLCSAVSGAIHQELALPVDRFVEHVVRPYLDASTEEDVSWHS